MYLYLNGEFVQSEAARISPYDHGFLYGLGLFETFRTYNGHPFLLDDHLDRLKEGLDTLNINFAINRKHILNITKKLLQLNSFDDAYCRLNISAGIDEIGFRTSSYEEPTVILFQKSLPKRNTLTEKRAAILKLNRNTPETGVRLKSHHYLNNIAAKRELGSATDIEGIFLTEQGFVAEGITSNIFWVKGDILFTPTVETGILNGITRQYIIKLAKSLQISVQVGEYRENDLLEADEIFFTNSIQEIVPVCEVNGKPYIGKQGTYANRLQSVYNKHKDKLFTIREIKGEGHIEHKN